MKRPITPPCHGGDRRFESGRARQDKTLSESWGFYLGQTSSVIRTGEAGAGAKEPRTEVYFEHGDCVLHKQPSGRAPAQSLYATSLVTEVAKRYTLKLYATLAQLVERHIRNVQVAGSIPAGGSTMMTQNYVFSHRFAALFP